MNKFTIIYVKGRAVDRGASRVFEAMPGKTTLDVESHDRASAFIKVYERLSKFGMEISVAAGVEKDSNPLGLTNAEVAMITEANISLWTAPLSGIRIEKILWNG